MEISELEEKVKLYFIANEIPLIVFN